MLALVKMNLFLKDAASVRPARWLNTFFYALTDLIKKESQEMPKRNKYIIQVQNNVFLQLGKATEKKNIIQVSEGIIISMTYLHTNKK
jgi:hypothetical protein